MKMKIIQLYGPKNLRIEDINNPACEPGKVKVKTEYCGLCGSDRPRLLLGEVPFFPNTLGHEFSATVIETGEGVKSVKTGDLVSIVPLIVCHTCGQCKTGHYGQCINKKFIGLRVKNKGGFAQFNVLPEENVLKAPEYTGKIEAAFIEPVSVAIHAIFRSGLKPGSSAAVIGTGTIGQLIIQCLKLMGTHKVYAFDVDNNQLEAARQYGADYCYNTTDKDFIGIYKDDTNGLGCPYVFEAVGLEQAVVQALDLCKVNGNIVLVGYLDKPIAFSAKQMRAILENEFNLIGVWQSYDLNFPGDAWRLGLTFLAEKKIDVQSMVYKIITPKEILNVLQEWDMPGVVKGKIMVDMSNL
jgi:L-iditol 2-dehydrogenase